MALDLSSYLLATNELSSVTKQNAMIQAIEDALNHLGSASFGAFTSGLIFDPAKIKQNGASSGQVLMWNGSAWTPTSPSTSTFSLIADSTLGADGVFSFTSIPNTFKHLLLVCYLRSNRAATGDTVGIRFNNDTAANYDGYAAYIFGTTPTITGQETLAATSGQGTFCPGNNATANVFSSNEILIPHYAGTANNKIAEMLNGEKENTTTGNVYVSQGMAAWRSNSAINRIDFLPTGGGTQFKTGSRVSLYGI